MKTSLYIAFLLLIALPFSGQQFYLRGEVRDEGGLAISKVSVRQLSTGRVFFTNNFGGFEIASDKEADTLFFSYAGFQNEKLLVSARRFAQVQMKSQTSISSNIRKYKLASFTKDIVGESRKNIYGNNETYASLIENKFVETKRFPATSLALNIDKASYSNIRRLINLGLQVPPDAVRIEEMLNYFNFGYCQPDDTSLFRFKSVLTSCPWSKDDLLFYINIFSKKLNLDSLPPSNLVFLVDISGSMDMPNRLPLLKSAFHMLAANLREKDTVSIVIYGGAVGIMLFPTGGNEKEKINKAIDELQPGGSTPGESGIRLAYSIAKKQLIKGGNNRIILATDGDFNVGLQTEQELDELISRHRESGIYLTCLGVGMGNYKDSKIQTLARKGNGNFAYIDNFQEAEKIIMKEFTQTLYTVADDVYMDVSFDPYLVKEYRLIGFDNKQGALEDSSLVIEGGEIGSGQSMIAAFEIKPNFKAGDHVFSEKFALVNLKYKLPNDSTRHEIHETFPYDPYQFKELDPIYRFATSVIMFGSILKNSEYTKELNWGNVLYHASESANPTDISQAQLVELVYKAKNFYTKSKKKRKKRF